MKGFTNGWGFFPALYRCVNYCSPTLIYFPLLSRACSNSFNWSKSPSIPGFMLWVVFLSFIYLFISICMLTSCLCSGNTFPLFHLLWNCNVAELQRRLRRTSKEETIDILSPVYIFLIHFIYNIHENWSVQ